MTARPRPGPAVPPVLIAGAGPAGLSLAHELARQGVPVRIVDQGPPRSAGEGRANGLHSRTLEVLERYGVVERVLGEGVRLTAAEMLTDDGRLLTRLPSGVPGTPYPFALILNQSRIERILIDALGERHGVAVERPVALEGFEQDASGVDAVLRHPDGRRERARFAALAACDGGRSTVRRALGLDFDGVRLEGAYVMDATARWTHPVAPGVLRMVAGPTGCVAAVGTPGGLVRVVAVLQADDERARREAPSVELMQAIIDEHPALGLVVEDSVWASGFHIANRNLDRLRHGRVVPLGDAAHIHSPMGGQGLNLGVQDAANLGWKLALWWRGLADDRILDSVDPERLPVIRGVLRRTRATQRALLLRSRSTMAARNTVMRTVGRLPLVVSRARRVNEEYGVHYRRSGAVRDAAPGRGRGRAGDLMPDVAGLSTETATGRRLYELTADDPRHTLLVVATAAGGPPGARQLRDRAGARFGAVLRALAVLPRGQHPVGPHEVVDHADGLDRPGPHTRTGPGPARRLHRGPRPHRGRARRAPARRPRHRGRRPRAGVPRMNPRSAPGRNRMSSSPSITAIPGRGVRIQLWRSDDTPSYQVVHLWPPGGAPCPSTAGDRVPAQREVRTLEALDTTLRPLGEEVGGIPEHHSYDAVHTGPAASRVPATSPRPRRLRLR